jgi:hypothetical protein
MEQGLEPSGEMEPQDLMVVGAVMASNVSLAPVNSKAPLSRGTRCSSPDCVSNLTNLSPFRCEDICTYWLLILV